MTSFDEAYAPSGVEDDADDYLRRSVEIDPVDIKEDFRRVSADLAYWGRRFADAHKDYLVAKARHDRVRASVYLETRETLSGLGARVTEAMIDAHVLRDASVVDAHASVVDAEHAREVCKATVHAVYAKRDMLVSLGAQVRAEMAGDPSLRADAE